MAPKIYGLPFSTCTARVLTTLFEKGVEDYELINVDLSTGAHKKPEFLKLQPFGVIPVYQDEDVTVFGQSLNFPKLLQLPLNCFVTSSLETLANMSRVRVLPDLKSSC